MKSLGGLTVRIRQFSLPLRPYTALAAGVTAGIVLGRGLLILPMLILVPVLLPLLQKYSRVALILGVAGGVISGTFYRLDSERGTREMPRPGLYRGCWQCQDPAATAHRQLSTPKLLAGIFTPEHSNRSYPVSLSMENLNIKPVYGQECTISGELRYSGNQYFTIEHNELKLHNSSRRSRALFTANTIGPLRDSGTIRNHLFRCREKILQRLLTGITDPVIADLTAKLFAGASGGFSSQQRQIFLVAGTIHIFAISGMHTAIFSALILWLFSPLPRLLKYPLTAVAVLFYVFMTGAGVPAVRAGSILIAWCLLQTCLRYVNSRCLLALCFSAMALLAPEIITDLGAQYSFTITAVLLMTAQFLGERKKAFRNRLELMPPRAALTQKYRDRLNNLWRILSGAAAIAAAFAAGCGISLYFRHQLSFGGILANVPVPVLTPLLFTVILVKIFTGAFLPALDLLLAAAIEALFRVLLTFTEWCAGLIPMSCSGHDSVWPVIFFYLAIWTFFCGPRRFRRTAVLTLGIILIFWAAPPFSRRAKLAFYSGEHGTPPAVFHSDNAEHRKLLLNTGGYASAGLFCNLMEQEGIEELTVVFSGKGIKCRQGIKVIENKFRCDFIQPKRNAERIPSGGIVLVHTDLTGLQWYLGDLSVLIKDSREKRTVTVKKSGQLLSEVSIPYSSLPIFWEVELP